LLCVSKARCRRVTPKKNTMKITSLKTIRNLSEESRNLFAEILTTGDMANRNEFEKRDGWDELVDENLVNCWDDDSGNQYCEIGEQS